MIKYVIYFMLGIISINSFSQNISNLSSEFELNYYYCFFGNTNNKLNYGVSFLFSKRIDKIKISTGINYTSKSYFIEFEPTSTSDDLVKRVYNMDYINVPILIMIGTSSKESFSFNLQTGFLANIPINYDIESYYLNDPPMFENDLDIDNLIGWTYRLGLNISRGIGQRLVVNLLPFFDVKLVSNGGNEDPNSYKGFPDDNLSIGVKLGLEYFYR